MTQFNQHLTRERWFGLSLNEQLANVGSEVHRAIVWKMSDPRRSTFAVESALELLDLTLEDSRHKKTPAMQELCRVREILGDYFYGGNEYQSSDESWEQYFGGFEYMAALERV